MKKKEKKRKEKKERKKERKTRASTVTVGCLRSALYKAYFTLPATKQTEFCKNDIIYKHEMIR